MFTDIALSLTDAVVDGVGNFFGWILIGGVGSAVAGYAALRQRVANNTDSVDDLEERTDDLEEVTENQEERLDITEKVVEQHTLRLIGDDDDPNNPGALERLRYLDDKLEQAREERQKEHQRVVESLETLEDKLDE